MKSLQHAACAVDLARLGTAASGRRQLRRARMTLAAAAILVGGAAFASLRDDGAPQRPPAGELPPGVDAAMMEKMIAAGSPGPHHEWMAKFVGSWDVDVTHWMAPGAPPSSSKAIAVAEMRFGGRFLVERVRGDFGGAPFEGEGVLGYDNVLGHFVMTWLDNFSTGIGIGEGKLSDDRKTFTSTLKMSDPITGGVQVSRSVETFPTPDTRHIEAFAKGPDGEEYKTMVLSYARRGRAPAAGAGGGANSGG
ncbi:MAG TPA: DUF1579 domain-containing protein [Phycisphaerales bacterium]|nr:DUF1579 domain-containing protein [Phycisphaerales bacterium]HMP36753.1 DUF1579 domain-containing protein [Phycisphaerales bacterium]